MATIAENGNGAHRAKRTAGDAPSEMIEVEIFDFVKA